MGNEFLSSDRNTHQVPVDVIEGRLRQYNPLIPFYFGLFLNHEQSTNVLKQAYDYYQQALQTFPQLKYDLAKISRDNSKESISFDLELKKLMVFLLCRYPRQCFVKSVKYEFTTENSSLYCEIYWKNNGSKPTRLYELCRESISFTFTWKNVSRLYRRICYYTTNVR